MFGSDHEYYLAAWAPEWTCTWNVGAPNIKYLDHGWPQVQNKIKIAKAFVTLGCLWLGDVSEQKGSCKREKLAPDITHWHSSKAGTLILRVPSLALGANFCSRLAGLWVQKAPGVSG